jgi:serine phosphatase RsbU (regulator of sigma subunit)
LGDRYYIAIADVAGFGNHAQYVTSFLAGAVSMQLRAPTFSPMPFLENLNATLLSLPGQAYATMQLIEINYLTNYLTCFNCGHPPPFIVSMAKRSIRPILMPSLPLGQDTTIQIASTVLDLEEGYLICYTKGFFANLKTTKKRALCSLLSTTRSREECLDHLLSFQEAEGKDDQCLMIKEMTL